MNNKVNRPGTQREKGPLPSSQTHSNGDALDFSVHLMNPTHESVAEYLERLLLQSKKDHWQGLNAEDREKFEETIEHYLEEITLVILDWMGVGNLDAINQTLVAMRRIMVTAADEPYLLDHMGSHDRLVAGISELCRLMELQLQTDNSTKIMGMLAGRRRASWRILLEKMHSKQHAVGVAEAFGMVDDFRHRNTAYHALEEMTRMGVLARMEGEGRAIYCLTLIGNGVARTLKEANQGSRSTSLLDQFQRDDTLSEQSLCGLMGNINFLATKSSFH
jgi:hypothetical protein